MKIETFFVPNFCRRAFHPRVRKLLNKANINNYYAHHKPNKSIAIKVTVPTWPKQEQIMADVYAKGRKHTSNSQ